MAARISNSIDSRSDDRLKEAIQRLAGDGSCAFDIVIVGSDTSGHPENPLFGQITAADFTGDRPTAQNNHPVTDIDEFLGIRRSDEDGAARFAQSRPNALDLTASTYIHAAR